MFLKQMANEPAACGAIHVKHHRSLEDTPAAEAANNQPAVSKSESAAQPASAVTAARAH
jgi:hypothetical protein